MQGTVQGEDALPKLELNGIVSPRVGEDLDDEKTQRFTYRD